MLNIPVSVCLYSGPTQTKYAVKTGIKSDVAYRALKTAYIAGIRNKTQKIIAATIFISSIDDKSDPRLADIAYEIFKAHQPTQHLVSEIHSLPVSRLKVHLENGTLEDAFSDSETDMLYTDFFMKNSIEGRA